MAKKLDLSGFDTAMKETPAPKGEMDLSGFDQAMGSEQTSMPSQEQPGMLEAGLRGAGQGLSFGFGDELVGALGAAKDKYLGNSEKSLEDLYMEYRDMERQKNAAASEAHPWISGGAEVLGALPTAFIPGLGASTLGRAAALGASYSLGKSDGGVTDAVKDTVIGGGLGAAGHVIAPYIGKAVSGLGNKFKGVSEGLEQEAFDTAGNVLGVDKKIEAMERGGANAESGQRMGFGKAAFENTGWTGGEEKVRENALNKIREIESVKKPLVEEAHNRLQTINSPAGSIQDILNVGDTVPLATKLTALKDELVGSVSKATTNYESIAGTVNKETGERAGGLAQRLEDTIERWTLDDNNILQLNELKQAIGKELGGNNFLKKSADLPYDAEFQKKAYGLINDRIEELADKVGPDFGKRIRALNQEESLQMRVRDTAFKSAVDKATKKSAWGMGDVVAMGMGSPLGPAGAIGALLTKKAGERLTGWNVDQLAKMGYGKGAMQISKGAGAIGEGLMSKPTEIANSMLRSSGANSEKSEPHKLSEAVYNAGDEELTGMATKLMNSPYAHMGEALQKSIMDKSSDQKNAILFSIMQNPKIRELITNGQ